MTSSPIRSRQQSQRKVGKSGLRRGCSIDQIAAVTGRTKQTVKIWKKSKSSSKRMEGSGRKSQYSKYSVNLRSIVNSNRHASVAQITKKLNLKAKSNHKRRTIQNWMKKLGFKKKRSVPKPKLNARHKADRKQWAKTWINVSDQLLDNVICVDEAGFEINDVPDRIWIHDDDDYPARHVEKEMRQPKVNLIGCISSVGPIVGLVSTDNVDSKMYKMALEHIRMMLRQKGLKGRISVVHDNAKLHFLAEKSMKCFNFGLNGIRQPAYSPDLNPIENAFHLTRQIRFNRNDKIKNLSQLSSRVKSWFRSLSVETCQNLIRSIPSRAKEVQRLNGEQTKF